jgi:hypothetical protein
MVAYLGKLRHCQTVRSSTQHRYRRFPTFRMGCGVFVFKPSLGSLQSTPGWVLMAVLLSIPATARADREKALSVGLGFSSYATPGKPAKDGDPPPTLSPTAGAALRLMYELAWTRDLSFRGSIAAGAFVGGGTSFYSEAAAGVTLRFDVLKYVPYAFAELGVIERGGGQINTATDPVLCLGGGVDILTRRDLSWGIEGQLSSFAGDFTVFSVGLRGTTRWDFF